MNERATIAGLAYRGRTGSIGFAHGPFVRLDGATSSGRVAGAPPDEKAALRAALIAAGRGDVPLVEMRWRCGNCGSRLTEFIVGGSHMRPR